MSFKPLLKPKGSKRTNKRAAMKKRPRYDAQVVYYDFTTSGSDHGKTGFVADKQKNAVTMTRHKSKPMPIGDTSGVGQYSQKRHNVEPRASYDFEAEARSFARYSTGVAWTTTVFERMSQARKTGHLGQASWACFLLEITTDPLVQETASITDGNKYSFTSYEASEFPRLVKLVDKINIKCAYPTPLYAWDDILRAVLTFGVDSKLLYADVEILFVGAKTAQPEVVSDNAFNLLFLLKTTTTTSQPLDPSQEAASLNTSAKPSVFAPTPNASATPLAHHPRGLGLSAPLGVVGCNTSPHPPPTFPPSPSAASMQDTPIMKS
ncbi:uncharacterized protein PAC_08310 [Phialocephala subalpina]|uniref:Uncharacterized protein n=1 Tax=Phialocephala subalpina TaxID=576137 RepID=A0A1L7X074_9HELO|nr:uncharacterized protein PAC_08310 [Phialocephala subalpina]